MRLNMGRDALRYGALLDTAYRVDFRAKKENTKPAAMHTSFIVSVLEFLSIFVAAHYLLQRRKVATFYLIAAGLFGIMNASELSDSFRLYQGKIETRGFVTGKNCGNHGQFTYAFQANEVSISHEIRASTVGLHCEDLSVGMELPVQYLRIDPGISIAGSARRWFFETLQFTLFLMFGMPALWLFIYFRQTRKTENQVGGV